MLRIGISSGGALLWAGLYLILSGGEILSLLAAVLMHECGHALALLLLDSGVDSICLTSTGLRIDYRRALTSVGELLAALAGPAFGLLWALCAHALNFELSCYLSLALTLFNMLPISIMDGGRALHGLFSLLLTERTAGRITVAVDAAFCALACFAGLWCAFLGLGAGAAIAAGWLVVYTVLTPCKTRLLGIK